MSFTERLFFRGDDLQDRKTRLQYSKRMEARGEPQGDKKHFMEQYHAFTNFSVWIINAAL